MAEHVDIVNVAGELRRACQRDDSAGARAHAATLARMMVAHTGAEEVGLFTVLRRQDEFERPVTRLCAEHVILDALLGALAEGDMSVIERFIDDLRDHIDREENGLFPAAAISLTGPEWEEVDALTPAPDAPEPAHHHPH
ncbi:MAG: hemerythrin domain-containing protein [Dermatophilaceae bacterium]